MVADAFIHAPRVSSVSANRRQFKELTGKGINAIVLKAYFGLFEGKRRVDKVSWLRREAADRKGEARAWEPCFPDLWLVLQAGEGPPSGRVYAASRLPATRGWPAMRQQIDDRAVSEFAG
jgi:hypothetical protein